MLVMPQMQFVRQHLLKTPLARTPCTIAITFGDLAPWSISPAALALALVIVTVISRAVRVALLRSTTEELLGRGHVRRVGLNVANPSVALVRLLDVGEIIVMVSAMTDVGGIGTLRHT